MEHPPPTMRVEPGGLWAKPAGSACQPPEGELRDLLADLRDDFLDRLERQEWMLRQLLQQKPASTSFLEAIPSPSRRRTCRLRFLCDLDSFIALICGREAGTCAFGPLPPVASAVHCP